jgi:hypothetical protein
VIGEAPAGTNRCTISDHAGSVIIHFETRCEFLALTPEEARQMGEALARQAYRAHFGDYPTTADNSAITESMRIRARNAVVMQLRQEPCKTEAELRQRASAIVDRVMKEML